MQTMTRTCIVRTYSSNTGTGTTRRRCENDLSSLSMVPTGLIRIRARSTTLHNGSQYTDISLLVSDEFETASTFNLEN
jgi:hypothetical protein